MRAFASSFHAWKQMEETEGTKVPHGLTFPLAVVEAIGRPHGLALAAEEHTPDGPAGFDAIFLGVLDAHCMLRAASHFAAWGVPFRRRDRRPVGRYPLVWAGGQGLHNPLPLAPCFDLAVIGDAEDPLPALLDLRARHGNTAGFLAAAATVPGVFVPDHHDPREATVAQSVSADVGITLREDIRVSRIDHRRVEIARGCRYKCTFCSLGWRTPVRENDADAVLAAIRQSPRMVHLQAGDAESHSGIERIREGLRTHGGFDTGWTGRLDTLLENPDVTVDGNKRYAFGVEGVSWRLRSAVGKGYLTDERLAHDTATFFRNVEASDTTVEGTRGRAAWHLIAGLPTERVDEARDLIRVIEDIDRRRASPRYGRGRPFNLALHWQPFCPLPGTPMQWCGVGGGVRKRAPLFEPLARRLPRVRVWTHVGRTDDVAKLTTTLARADERGADLLEALARGRVTPDNAVALTGSPYGALDPDAPTPWDFVQQHYGRDVLRRAYDVMMRRLRGEGRALPVLTIDDT